MWSLRNSASSSRAGAIQASAPANIIEGGIPTAALLAQIAVFKYAESQSLYWQEAIYARDQVKLDRQPDGAVDARAGGRGDYIFSEVKKVERVFAGDHLADARSRLWIGEDDRVMGLCPR
ncbi:hypothetical protein ABIF86_000380 [Bradyrhizobium japonicum]